jgi:hypothetical protein
VLHTHAAWDHWQHQHMRSCWHCSMVTQNRSQRIAVPQAQIRGECHFISSTARSSRGRC